MAENFRLEMLGITKRYGATTVVSNVTLCIKPGEIHALLGENGAGKSTLMNILFGMPVIHETGGFEGTVKLDGEAITIASPFDAMQRGIGMVHQEFMLIPGFSITENIKLNREIAKPNLVSRVLGKPMETLDMPAMRADARFALDSVGMGIEEFALVKGLPVGYMQFVEIAREIDKKGVKLLVFDEPTAVLTESEAEQLMTVMREITAKGIAIIFITHRLDEVMAAADNITILRDGKLVATRSTAQTSLTEMAELMIGRKGEGVIEVEARAIPESTPVALKLDHLSVRMPGEVVKDVTLSVYEGEILGIGGLAGQGKVGIPNGIMGLFPGSGDVEFFGQKLGLNDAKNALASGLAMVSEDRRGVGLLLEEPIEENIAFNAIQVKDRFQKAMIPDPTPLKKGWWKWILLVLLTVACLFLAINGDAQWSSKKSGAPAVIETAEELPVVEGAAAALSEDAAPLEIVLDEEVVALTLFTEPAMARLSPLFFILGAMGCLVILYSLLYPFISGFVNRFQVEDKKAVRAYANQMIKELDIRCRGPLQAVGQLSGGNQQKVCVARALALTPKFLFVSEPTRGIDIGAKRLVLETLVKLNREQGMTIVMVSSELLELRSVCDRIAIIAEGKVAGIFGPDAADADLGLAMSGIVKGGKMA